MDGPGLHYIFDKIDSRPLEVTRSWKVEHWEFVAIDEEEWEFEIKSAVKRRCKESQCLTVGEP